MARLKKKHNDPALSMEQLLFQATTLFHIPYNDHDERDPSLPSLRFVANEMGTTILKVRKLLITADYYTTSTSRLIQRLIDSGCTVENVMKRTGLKTIDFTGFFELASIVHLFKIFLSLT